MGSKQYLNIGEAARVTGKTTSWVKKRIISGSLEGRFEEESWWVSILTLQSTCGPLDTRKLELKTFSEPVVYDFLPPIGSAKKQPSETRAPEPVSTGTAKSNGASSRAEKKSTRNNARTANPGTKKKRWTPTLIPRKKTDVWPSKGSSRTCWKI